MIDMLIKKVKLKIKNFYKQRYSFLVPYWKIGAVINNIYSAYISVGKTDFHVILITSHQKLFSLQ